MTQSRILLVDDDEFVLKSLAETLSQEGYEVTPCQSGEEALEVAKKTTFDLALVDIRMPEMDGFEVLKGIKEAAPDTVVMMITGYASIESAVEAMKEGAYDYLVKPCAPEELTLRVARGLEKRRLLLRNGQMEEALRASVRQWHSTFDAISDAVCLLDPEGKILRCNKAMTELLGKPSSEIIGCTCYEVVHGTSERIEGCPVVRMRETGRGEALTLPTGDRWLSIVVGPLLDEDGSLIGTVHIMSDITERKRVEEALKAAHRELQEKVERLEKFHRITMGREKRIMELKKEVKELEEKLREREAGA